MGQNYSKELSHRSVTVIVLGNTMTSKHTKKSECVKVSDPTKMTQERSLILHISIKSEILSKVSIWYK